MNHKKRAHRLDNESEGLGEVGGLGEDANVEINGLIQSKSKEFSRRDERDVDNAHPTRARSCFSPPVSFKDAVFQEIDGVSRLR